jgi:hypothetical protein
VRLAAAIGMIAVTLSAALYVHQRRVTITIPATGHPVPECANGSCYLPNPGPVTGYTGGTPGYSQIQHPSWEDPVAVLLAIGGVAVAVGIVRVRS